MPRQALLALLAFAVLTAAAKKKKEEETQTLQLPKDPPAAVAAETRRLVFHVTPLSARGLLSQQVRDALKALFHATGSAAPVKLRAFVAGSGDVRRVRDITSEAFTDRRQPLPALSVIQVGALPLEGAQVVLESTSVAKKDLNDYGLVFISAQPAASAEQSLDAIRTALKAAGSEPADVLRATCFLSSLDHGQAAHQLFATAFPQAAFDYVQLQRAPAQDVAACEAVAKLRWNTGSALHVLNPDGLPSLPGSSQVALVAAPKIVLTGTQVSFGFQDSDARLAFERLDKALAPFNTSLRQAAMIYFYPLSQSLAAQVRKIRTAFYDQARPPATTLLPFEGLPSMDAGFAVDAVAITDR
jgi:enamine deaminase RidA (YjgF/YER057c/UK114 family)